MALVIVLLVAGAVALQGRMPGPRTATDPATADDSGSLVAVIAMLGVSFVVMAFAMFARRPAAPKSVPFEMADFGGGGPGRMNRRLLLIVFAVVILWLGIFVAASQIRLEADAPLTAPPPTPTAAPDGQPQPTPPSQPAQPRSDTYRLLVGATGVLLVMTVAATVITAVRNRSTLPPVALVGRPEGDQPVEPGPLALAAERGLAEVANPALPPREAIIACYAAMEQALAAAPGAAPQASDTPTEVLARAVGNRAISTGSANTLVDLFAEARFSRHTMTEVHREEAEQALRSVLNQLQGLRASP